MSDNIFNSIFPDDTDPADQDLTEAARSAAESAADSAADTAGDIIEGATDTVDSVANAVTGEAADTVAEVTDSVTGAAAEIADAAGPAVEFASDFADNAVESSANIADAVADRVTGAADTMADEAGAIFAEAVEDDGPSPLERLYGAAASLFDAVIPDGKPEVAIAPDAEILPAAAVAADEVTGAAAEVTETVADTVEHDRPSPLERLFGAASSLVDTVIPDGEPDIDIVPDAEILPAAALAVEETAEDVGEALASPVVDLAPAAIRSRAPEGVLSPPPPPEVEPVQDSKQWDDELSPELAAVLFAGQRAASKLDTAESAVVDTTKEAGQALAGSVLQAEPILAALAPATPIELTRIEEARSLHLYANGHSAAAPNVPLVGKVRYSRTEEPLKNDKGQRIKERWQYYKPDYPGLSGRLVREVRSEEIIYSDGSWHWSYERRYADRGRDRREVRAAADRKYIERRDEVSTIDAGTDKRTSFKAEARLIFAPPEEEKRGGFFSALLGKDDDAAVLSPVWREASTKEARAARKSGGSAF